MPDHAVHQTLQAAVAQYQAGNLRAAEKLCRQILSREPNNVDALNVLGGCLYLTGDLDEAIEIYQRIAALKPDLPEAHNNLGGCLQRTGRVEDAIAAFKTAIRLKGDFPVAKSNLATAYFDWGNALSAKGQTAEALDAFQQAVAFKPDFIEAYNNLGIALQGNGQLDEAIVSFRQAIRLKPELGEAHNNLGAALNEVGKPDEAIAALRQAIRLKPDFAAAHSNLGNGLMKNGQVDEAIAAFRQAVALNPNLPEAHNSLAYALLGQGDFEQGWQELEWRWKDQSVQIPRRDLSKPQWDGSPLADRTILIQTELGFGDTLQFIRYLPMVAQRGGRIIVECQKELQRLFQIAARGCQVVARGQSLPDFDLQCPLLSLPQLFGTTLANVPNMVPYLHADAEDAKRWQERLADRSPVVKVGLVWAGNPTNSNDRNRSMKLAALAPLGQVPGARFFSLQTGAAAAEAKTPPPGFELVDWTQELKDFADTAALIANLDLVIAVDTAAAHLAGAMGKPVWTLLTLIPSWRWFLDRDDSPWYPTMRLFRQTTPGDWLDVVQRVAKHLEKSKPKT